MRKCSSISRVVYTCNGWNNLKLAWCFLKILPAINFSILVNKVKMGLHGLTDVDANRNVN